MKCQKCGSEHITDIGPKNNKNRYYCINCNKNYYFKKGKTEMMGNLDITKADIENIDFLDLNNLKFKDLFEKADENIENLLIHLNMTLKYINCSTINTQFDQTRFDVYCIKNSITKCNILHKVLIQIISTIKKEIVYINFKNNVYSLLDYCYEVLDIIRPYNNENFQKLPKLDLDINNYRTVESIKNEVLYFVKYLININNELRVINQKFATHF